jgi:Ca2+-binding RTX toxin-like protein
LSDTDIVPIAVVAIPIFVELIDVAIGGESQGVLDEILGVPGMAISLVFTTDDPTAFFMLDWGDGAVDTDPVVDGDTITFTHVYTVLGTYQPTLDAAGETFLAEGDISPAVIQRVANHGGVVYIGGGEGSDRILLSNNSFGRLNIRYNNVAQSPQDAYRVVLFGNGGNDTMSVVRLPMGVEFHGGAGDDYLAGGAFDDVLVGGDGRDRLQGGGGNDLILGGAGHDQLSGGAGNDILWGDGLIDLVGGAELPDGSFSLPGDIIDSDTPGNDRLSGDAGSDILRGGGGNDLVYGGVGNDYLYGEDGADMLDGGAGNDFAYGGIGADAVYGRAGRDILIGGEGTDRLLGGTSGDLLFGGAIDDFVAYDPFALEALWSIFSSTSDPDAAFDALEFDLGAYDDGYADSAHGETDADWYLMYTSAGDRFLQTSERNLPNRHREI